MFFLGNSGKHLAICTLLLSCFIQETISGQSIQAVTSEIKSGQPVAIQGEAETSLSKAELTALSSFNAGTLKQITTTLTSDNFQGRGAAQPGGEKAALYIADWFRRTGLKPLGEHNSYLQKVDLRGYRVQPQTTVVIDGTPLRKDQDFLVMPFDMSRFPLKARMDAQGELVLAGFGLNSEIPKRHDLDGISVKNKIVMIFEGIPETGKLEEWASVNMASITSDLARRGAAAILIIGSKEFPKALLDLAGRRGVALYDHSKLNSPTPPILSITSAVASKVFASAGMDFDSIEKKANAGEYVSTELHKRASISLRLQFEAQRAASYNVIGYLAGSDPKLSKEAVVYTAHHDAYGIEPDGRIFPGAGDNAVNVANLIEIANALNHSPQHPRRSIIFIATTGEELWKLGAFYWVNHPTWPMARVAANLNMDGIGSDGWGEMKDFYAIGIQQSNLRELVADTCQALGLQMIPDTLKDAQLLQRSDTFEFATHGVPFVYGIGLPGDLSQVGAKFGPWLRDVVHYELDKVGPSWHWEGTKKYGQFLAILGMRVANKDELPVWEPSSPFNRPRF